MVLTWMVPNHATDSVLWVLLNFFKFSVKLCFCFPMCCASISHIFLLVRAKPLPSSRFHFFLLYFPWLFSILKTIKQIFVLNMLRSDYTVSLILSFQKSVHMKCWGRNILKGIVHPKINIHLISTHHYADGGVGKVFESTTHFRSFRGKQRIQNNWLKGLHAAPVVSTSCP